MKKIISLALVLTMILSLTALVACGKDDEVSTTTSSTTASTPAAPADETTTAAPAAQTTAAPAETTTNAPASDDATTELPNSETSPIETTDEPAVEETTTALIPETTATTAAPETTTEAPGETTIFKSAWGAWDTYDIITQERVTADLFITNNVTVTFTTTISCSNCKNWLKSYMNTLQNALRPSGGGVCVILIFAENQFYEPDTKAANIKGYQDWYAANNAQYPFIVADELLQNNTPNGVPNVDIWVTGTTKTGDVLKGAHKLNYYLGTGGIHGQEAYNTVWDTCVYWLNKTNNYVAP